MPTFGQVNEYFAF